LPDNISSSTIVSTGGLDSSQNHLYLDSTTPGMATDLLNYEVGLNGGYRKISGFAPLNAPYRFVDDTNAEGQILGLTLFKGNGVERIIAARKQKSGNTYNFYYYDEGSGWNPYTTGLTLNTISGPDTIKKIRSAEFNFGNRDYIIFVDGVNNATLTDGTDWYSLSPTGAGTEPDPGGDQLIEKPSLVTVFQNHIFLSGDPEYKALVVHSAPQDPFNFTSAAGAGQIPTGFPVVQIKPFRDFLYVFGNTQIKYISVSETTFVIKDVTTNIGCIAPDSVIEMSGDILFLAPDGIRPISGTDKIGDVNIATVSKQIQFLVSNLIGSYDLTNLNSVVIRNKSQFRYFVSAPSSAAIGDGLIGGLRSPENSTGWEFSKLRGIRASVSTSGYYQTKELVLHGDYDGSVYKQEFGSSFNGTDILSIYTTPFLTLTGDSKTKKMIRSISMFYRLEGSLVMNISNTFDWNDPLVLNPLSYTQGSTIANVQYGDGTVYGDGSTYSNPIRSPVLEVAAEGSFFSIKLSFTTSDQNPAHSIQGFIIEYTQQERR